MPEILRSVYYTESDILSAEVGRSPSQVWRSIVEGGDILKLDIIRRIGNGVHTKIWMDNWIPRDYKLTPVCPVSTNPPVLVSDLNN